MTARLLHDVCYMKKCILLSGGILHKCHSDDLLDLPFIESGKLYRQNHAFEHSCLVFFTSLLIMPALVGAAWAAYGIAVGVSLAQHYVLHLECQHC